MKIIDTHTHFSDGQSVIGGPAVSAGRMVEMMDEYGVECCWCSSMTALSRDYHEANERQWLQTKEYPGRFMNYCVVNGNYPEQIEDEIRLCVEDRGFGGLKFHNWCSGFPIDSRGTHRAMEMAIEYDIPVLFHDGTPPWAETLQVAAIAEYYPEARVMIGHSGLFDAWQSAIQACNTLDNVWLGICGPCVGDAAEIIKSVRPDRILFGSDFAVNDKPYLLEERINVLKLACPDESLQQQIFYDNAVEILKKTR